MKRILMTLAAVLLTTATADAGGRICNAVQNVRGAVQEWRAERLANRGTCQPAQQYTQPTHPPGPVVTAAGTVLVQTGQVIQAAGQTVQAWPGLVRPTTCSGGTCR